ncbi:MAG TPA: 2TM domain-containing protein [Thermomicrobiales bacterium]|nr:2TM domain-containing protein [Thermomicrobiales bacterium]
MNGSILLNLYPRGWRARYEAEFRAMLEEHPISAMEALDIVLGAADAHLRPQAHQRGSAPPARQSPATRAESGQTGPTRGQAFLYAHLALFVAIISLLALINVFFTPGNWWVLYPLWAWGTILGTHAALVMRWSGLLGAHVVFYTLLNAGLVGINISQGGDFWAIWPIIGLGILLVAHALIAGRGVSLIQAHGVATILAAVALLMVGVATQFDGTVSVLFAAAELGVLLAAHWLMRYRSWNLLAAHTFVYAGVLTLMLVSNLIVDPDDLWVRYPFAFWTVLLIGHALIHFRVARWSGSDWEALMLEQLGTRGETDRQRRLIGTLGAHVYLFLIATVGFIILNMMSDAGNAWAAWPIGIWYVLLAFHAGYVMAPRRIVGSLLVGWVATSVGLVVIDIVTGGNTWWYWPVMWSGVVVAAIAGWMWTRGRPLAGAHLLGGLALGFALVVTDLVTGEPAWWFYPVAVILVSFVAHFAWTMDLNKMLGLSGGKDR